jgi:hypothetical protein
VYRIGIAVVDVERLLFCGETDAFDCGNQPISRSAQQRLTTGMYLHGDI